MSEIAPAMLIVYYPGSPDAELTAQVKRVLGEPDWEGAGTDRDGRGVEMSWERPSREDAEQKAARVSSGVSRSKLSIRVRTKGKVQ